MKRYVSIDIETTGLDSSNCQIIEFGAVIEDWKTPVEQLPYFHAYLFHNQIVGQPYALAMNAAILKKIAKVTDQMKAVLPGDMPEVFLDGERYIRPRILGRRFSEFLLKNGIDPKRVVPAGKNFGSFDRQFLKEVESFGKEVTFTHRSIDPGTSYWRPEIEDVPPGTEECMKRAGIEGEVQHNAVADAITVIRLNRYARSTEYQWRVAMELLNKSMEGSGISCEADRKNNNIVIIVKDSAAKNNTDLASLLNLGALSKRDYAHQVSVRNREEDRMPAQGPVKHGL